MASAPPWHCLSHATWAACVAHHCLPFSLPPFFCPSSRPTLQTQKLSYAHPPTPYPEQKGKVDPYLSMIHNMVEQGKVSDKAYEQREENREAANRKHQLEMMALIMGNQQRSHAT